MCVKEINNLKLSFKKHTSKTAWKTTGYNLENALLSGLHGHFKTSLRASPASIRWRTSGHLPRLNSQRREGQGSIQQCGKKCSTTDKVSTVAFSVQDREFLDPAKAVEYVNRNITSAVEDGEWSYPIPTTKQRDNTSISLTIYWKNIRTEIKSM